MILLAVLTPLWAFPRRASASEPLLPTPVARYAAITADSPQRPWNLSSELAPALGFFRYPDPIAPPPQLAPPLPPEKKDGEDPAYWNLRSGLNALREGKVEEALFELAEGLKKSGSEESKSACAFWLGEARMRKGKPAEAGMAYRKVEGKDRAEALYRQARIAQTGDRQGAARTAWTEIAAEEGNPHRAEALYRLAMFDIEEKGGGDAQVNFAAALSIAAQDSDVAAAAAFEAARLNRDAGNPTESERLLMGLLLSRPDHPLAQAGRVLLAWVESDLANYPAAISRLETALGDRALPEALALRARYALARAYAARGDLIKAREAGADLLLVGEGPWAGWASSDYASALYRVGKIKEALAAWEEAAKLWRGEGAGEVSYAIGECLVSLGRFGEAARRFATADPASETAPYAYHRGAEALRNAGDGPAAQKLLEKILVERPDYPDRDGARSLAGRILFDLGREREALAALEPLPEGAEGQSLLYLLRAKVSFGAERFAEASALLDKYLAAGREMPARFEAAALLGRAEYEQGKIDAAVAALQLAAKEAKKPEDAEKARYDIGWMLIATGRDAEGAAELEKLLADFPRGGNNARARYALGQSRFMAGRFDEALSRFSEVEKNPGEPELAKIALKDKIETLFAMGKNAEVLAECDKLGDDADGMGGAVVALIRLGRLDDAVAGADRFAARHPDNPGAADLELALSDALLAAGRRLDAAIRLEKGAARLTGTRRDEARSQLAGLLEEEGKKEEALAVWAALLDSTDDSEVEVMAARRAAALEAALGRSGKAVERLSEALKLPGLGDELARRLYNDLAENLLFAGDAPGALEKARRATVLGGTEGSDEELRSDWLLATALEKTGNPNAALERFLQIGYHYGLNKPLAVGAAKRAVELLSAAGRAAEAGELGAKISAAAGETAQPALAPKGE